MHNTCTYISFVIKKYQLTVYVYFKFQACPPGTFGPNCINKCSGNCLHHATCDKETGKCKACSEGWRNDFCNEST